MTGASRDLLGGLGATSPLGALSIAVSGGSGTKIRTVLRVSSMVTDRRATCGATGPAAAAALASAGAANCAWLAVVARAARSPARLGASCGGTENSPAPIRVRCAVPSPAGASAGGVECAPSPTGGVETCFGLRLAFNEIPCCGAGRRELQPQTMVAASRWARQRQRDDTTAKPKQRVTSPENESDVQARSLSSSIAT